MKDEKRGKEEKGGIHKERNRPVSFQKTMSRSAAGVVMLPVDENGKVATGDSFFDKIIQGAIEGVDAEVQRDPTLAQVYAYFTSSVVEGLVGLSMLTRIGERISSEKNDDGVVVHDGISGYAPAHIYFQKRTEGAIPERSLFVLRCALNGYWASRKICVSNISLHDLVSWHVSFSYPTHFFPSSSDVGDCMPGLRRQVEKNTRLLDEMIGSAPGSQGYVEAERHWNEGVGHITTSKDE